MKLYELLAAELATSIHSGALRTGEKPPSIRQVTANRGISSGPRWQRASIKPELSCTAHLSQKVWHLATEGGYFLWVEMPEGVNALEIHKQALSHGISVAPGPIFSAKRACPNCLRLNYGHTRDARSKAALATLGRLVALAVN